MKISGLGESMYLSGVDVSGDIGSLSNVHGGPALLDVTGINKYAHERIGGLIDSGLGFQAWFNPTGAHDTLAALPTADVVVMWTIGSTIGLPAACALARQINYDATRAADGGLSFAVEVHNDGTGLEWCDLLTDGLRTDVAATNGDALDGGAASTTGWAAYLQLTAFTGTDVTVKLQDSANNIAWADVTAGAFTQAAGVTSERIVGASGATLRRYVRAVTTTVGGVTSATFAVAVTRHPIGASE